MNPELYQQIYINKGHPHVAATCLSICAALIKKTEDTNVGSLQSLWFMILITSTILITYNIL